jgi:hypothetical protein
MAFGQLELLFIVALIVVAVFFFNRCSMKCKCKSNNGGADTYKEYKSYDGMGDMDETGDMLDDEDAAYSLPYAGGEITPGAWSLPFGGGKVIPDGTYADTGIGTF